MKSARAAARQTAAAEETAAAASELRLQVADLHVKLDDLKAQVVEVIESRPLGSSAPFDQEQFATQLAELTAAAVEAAVAPVRTELAELRRANSRNVARGH
jgi:shikimate 5-dehydrogenase